LGDTARSAGLGNVHPIWCDLEEANGIKITDGELDVGVLVNTLFMLEDKVTAVKEMARTVRQGGKFFVIDWTESFAGLGPTPDHVVDKAAATALFESNGFVLEREFPAGDHHYGLALRKV
jgi:SAM-dependent methyltransferase